MLIGALGSALLFVSIGAGTQSEQPTQQIIQVSENPYPWEYNGNGTYGTVTNRQTGESWSVRYEDESTLISQPR